MVSIHIVVLFMASLASFGLRINEFFTVAKGLNRALLPKKRPRDRLAYSNGPTASSNYQYHYSTAQHSTVRYSIS